MLNADSLILITGGAGYIGSHTVHHLICNGVKPQDIIVFDNLVYGHKEHLPPEVIFIKGDLTNKKEIDHVFNKFNIKSVIHFAAYAYVGESMQEPGKYFNNNLSGGLNLLEAMYKYKCKKIVFSSTCSTFGLPEKLPITEDELQKPINPYGESKLMFEGILEWYRKIYNINYVVLRYFNAAGAGYGIGEKHDPETHLIPLVIQAALGQIDNIEVFGVDYDTNDGTCIRDYIHVLDLADAHSLALNYLNNKNESLSVNLGTSKGVSVREIIQLVKEVSKNNFNVVEGKRRKGDPAVLVGSNTMAKKLLNWSSSRGIVEIIESAWKWHKEDGQ
jgi:UDP-glucose 4-epimerase